MVMLGVPYHTPYRTIPEGSPNYNTTCLPDLETALQSDDYKHDQNTSCILHHCHFWEKQGFSAFPPVFFHAKMAMQTAPAPTLCARTKG